MMTTYRINESKRDAVKNGFLTMAATSNALSQCGSASEAAPFGTNREAVKGLLQPVRTPLASMAKTTTGLAMRPQAMDRLVQNANPKSET